MPCRSCSRRPTPRTCSITTEADSWLGFIQGDSARLEQVVANLLSNAVKFTPDGGTVHVQLKRVQDFVEIQVRDTGQGISADFLPYVFEPFRQADGSTTRVHGGLGLGLSIVKHLVEAHGGMCRAQSAGPGQGARFIARFPIDPACAMHSHRPVARCESASPLRRRRSLDRTARARRRRRRGKPSGGRRTSAGCHGAMVLDGRVGGGRLRRPAARARRRAPGRHRDAGRRRLHVHSTYPRGLVPASASIPAAAMTAFTRKEDRQLALAPGFRCIWRNRLIPMAWSQPSPDLHARNDRRWPGRPRSDTKLLAAGC